MMMNGARIKFIIPAKMNLRRSLTQSVPNLLKQTIPFDQFTAVDIFSEDLTQVSICVKYVSNNTEVDIPLQDVCHDLIVPHKW